MASEESEELKKFLANLPQDKKAEIAGLGKEAAKLIDLGTIEKTNTVETVLHATPNDTYKDAHRTEAPTQTATKDLEETKAIGDPQHVAEQAQETAEKNDPTKGNEQTPQQAQMAQNAIDRALDKQTKAQVVEIGRTLLKEGVTVPKQELER